MVYNTSWFLLLLLHSISPKPSFLLLWATCSVFATWAVRRQSSSAALSLLQGTRPILLKTHLSSIHDKNHLSKRKHIRKVLVLSFFLMLDHSQATQKILSNFAKGNACQRYLCSWSSIFTAWGMFYSLIFLILFFSSLTPIILIIFLIIFFSLEKIQIEL